MTRPRRSARLALPLLALAGALGLGMSAAPRRAHAAPLLEAHPGGIGFTGPTSAGVAAAFWNPAALGFLAGHHVTASGSARLDSNRIERAPIASATGEPTEGGDRTFAPVDADTTTPAGFAGGVSDLNTTRYRFALATYTPFAEVYPDDPALAYHARGGAFHGLFTTVALAVRGSPNFMAGGGLSFVFSRLDLRFARDRGLEACPAGDCPVEEPTLAEHIDVRSDDVAPALAFHAGFLVRSPRLPRLWLGAAYVSEPTSFGRSDIRKGGDVAVVGTLPDGVHGYRVIGEAKVAFRLPQMLHLGARYTVDERTDVHLAARWIDLSVHRLYDFRFAGAGINAAEVPEWVTRYRGLRDVVSLQVAAEHAPLAGLRLHGHLRGETSGVTTSLVTPAQLDAPKLELGAAAEVRLAGGLSLAAGYALALHRTQDVRTSAFSPSAYRSCTASGHDLDVCAAARVGRALPTAAGRYERFTNELTATLTYHWW